MPAKVLTGDDERQVIAMFVIGQKVDVVKSWCAKRGLSVGKSVLYEYRRLALAEPAPGPAPPVVPRRTVAPPAPAPTVAPRKARAVPPLPAPPAQEPRTLAGVLGRLDVMIAELQELRSWLAAGEV